MSNIAMISFVVGIVVYVSHRVCNEYLKELHNMYDEIIRLKKRSNDIEQLNAKIKKDFNQLNMLYINTDNQLTTTRRLLATTVQRMIDIEFQLNETQKQLINTDRHLGIARQKLMDI